MSTALTEVSTHAVVRPVLTPAAMIEVHKEVSTLIAEALQSGTDFGVIPGTGDKPTLLKPGAERLVKAFACVARYHIVTEEREHNYPVQWQKRKKVWNNKFRGDKTFTWAEETGTALGLYRYVIRCEIVRLDLSDVVGEGIGSCSTMESKYVDRPRDSENTVLKMAQKRALVAATLNAFGLSNRFTQDVEDLDLGKSEPEPAAPAEPEPEPWSDEEKAAFMAAAKAAGIKGKALKDLIGSVAGLDAEGDPKRVLKSHLPALNSALTKLAVEDTAKDYASGGKRGDGDPAAEALASDLRKAGQKAAEALTA